MVPLHRVASQGSIYRYFFPVCGFPDIAPALHIPIKNLCTRQTHGPPVYSKNRIDIVLLECWWPRIPLYEDLTQCYSSQLSVITNFIRILCIPSSMSLMNMLKGTSPKILIKTVIQIDEEPLMSILRVLLSNQLWIHLMAMSLPYILPILLIEMP